MPTIRYVGRQRIRQQLDEMTVASSTVGHTFVSTVGVKAITYIAVTGDTTVTIAAAILALLQASTEGEFAELTFAEGSTTSKITATGPDDGAPFVLTVSGTGTYTTTTLTAALSPSDLGDVLNYSTGALPSAADTLVIEDTAADFKYNGAALAGIALASVIRRATHTGRLGLLTQNPRGYVEYRTSDVSLDSVLILIETAQGDAASQVRINSINTACTFTVTGAGQAAVGAEVVEVRGLVAASIVRAAGGSVAVAPLAGQVATVATLLAENAAVRFGNGVTFATGTLVNCQSRISSSWSTSLTMLSGGTCEVLGSAGGPASGTLVYAGTMQWKSTGSPGNSPVIGPGGTFDLTEAPAALTVGGTVSLSPGGTWLDPAGRVATYALKLDKCKLSDSAFDPGTNRTLTVS